jgi:hypothetical protein
MTSPSEGRAQSTQKENHDDSENEITRTTEKHIFFLGWKMNGARTHSPPNPHQRATSSVSSYAVCPSLPKVLTRLVMTGEFPACDDYASVSSTQWPIVKSKRGKS